MEKVNALLDLVLLSSLDDGVCHWMGLDLLPVLDEKSGG